MAEAGQRAAAMRMRAIAREVRKARRAAAPARQHALELATAQMVVETRALVLQIKAELERRPRVEVELERQRTEVADLRAIMAVLDPREVRLAVGALMRWAIDGGPVSDLHERLRTLPRPTADGGAA